MSKILEIFSKKSVKEYGHVSWLFLYFSLCTQVFLSLAKNRYFDRVKTERTDWLGRATASFSHYFMNVIF